MEWVSRCRYCLLLAVFALATTPVDGVETFRVATFNLNNYLDVPTLTRPAKSPAARAKIRETFRNAGADVVAVQEMGAPSALHELRAALREEGLDYPHWEHVTGFDTNIHVAVLSRFPIVARRPHTNDAFLLFGRRFHVARGFAEVDVRVNKRYTFTLLTAHLKSKREVGYADQLELRNEEALLLRRIIDRHLNINPAVNLVILGDLNDTKNSDAIRTLIGRGRRGLVDTRPQELNGDDRSSNSSRLSRPIAWTHFFEKEDSYSRIDYILASYGMSREWKIEGTHIVTVPNWGVGSDHRMLVATFVAEEQ